MAGSKLPARRAANLFEGPRGERGDRRGLASRILKAWEANSRTGSLHTLDAKRRDLAAFAGWLGLVGGDEQARLGAVEALLFEGFGAAQESVRSWLGWMAEKVDDDKKPRRSPATRARRLAHLRGLVRVAQEYGLPWGLQLKGPSVRPHRDSRGPEAWKVYAVIAAVVRESVTDPRAARDGALLQLLFVMGLRRQSIADLQLEDYVEGELWLLCKGEEERTRKTVPRSTQAALDRWLAHRGLESGALFTLLRAFERGRALTAGQIYRVCRKYGLGNPHGLRHSGATRLAKEGRNVFQIQAHLGQKSATSAQHYVDDVEDLSGEQAAYLAEDLDALYDGPDANR